ncbi:MAG: hypothetical protein JOY60_09935 [Burkholderiaceae bacterium]|nr:hypothetical protein [Roseateles sp.]MBV8470162.1 hypothetical protein [Burkholderiaceae bacterium]
MSITLHLQTVPARNGVLWVRHGFKVFQRKPMSLLMLLLGFMFSGMVVALIPGIGSVLVLAALPLVSLGFMLATHQILQGKRPTLTVFISPLKLTPQRRNTQLALGLAYALATIGIMALADWIDEGALQNLQDLLSKGTVDPSALEAAMTDPRLLWGIVARVGLLATLSVPFWHAPALVHWGGQGAMQALFSSTLGVWRNRAAFTVSALCWFGVMVSLCVITSLILTLFELPGAVPMMSLSLGLLLSTVFYASLYFTFVDCFMFGAPRDLPLNEVA